MRVAGRKTRIPWCAVPQGTGTKSIDVLSNKALVQVGGVRAADDSGECCEQDQSSEKEKTRPAHRFIPDTSK
jgi:hypothetical protein